MNRPKDLKSAPTRLHIKPCELKDANEFINRLHRHHKQIQGHRFSLSARNDADEIVGVACVGRPTARHINQREVLEVTRLCTDGTKNSCSMLYAAAARVGKEMGYKKIQTYILASESGVSLIASGWLNQGECGGGSWTRKNRIRIDKSPIIKKIKFEKILNK